MGSIFQLSIAICRLSRQFTRVLIQHRFKGKHVMARTAVALIVGLAAAFAPLSGAQAQTSNSIEDAPGYRTVPVPEPVEATIGSPGVFGTTDTDPAAPDPYSSGVLPSEPALEQLTPTLSIQDQLEAFAQTAVKVQTIAQLWQPVIEGAISSGEAVNLRQQANAEKLRAIQDLGVIAPQAYAQINEAARTNPELRAEIEALYLKAISQLPAGG
jgi:hypothetical protein